FILVTITNDLVVPLMQFCGTGIIKSWGKVIGLLKSSLNQFIVYALLKLGFVMITSIIELGLALIVFIAVFIFVLIVGLICVLAWIGLSAVFPAMEALLIPAIIAAVAFLIMFSLAVGYLMIVLTLPIPVFFRYYNVLFMKRACPEMNVLTGQKPKDKKTGEKTKTPSKDTAKKKTKAKRDEIKAY
ncbi:MAG: hypothetical protein NTU61_04455, partial [Candidatus Altiarchaeota archaeon]|nr:hypothetical protein [Candidatus Altiarchaeota archaeon]